MYLYQSNHLELLCDELCSILAQPLSNALQPNTIVVQNQGMATWLSQQIAAKTGIAANLHYPLPGRFFWDLLSSQIDDLPLTDPFSRDILLWRLYRILAAPLDQDDDAIRHYLASDDQGRRRYQLAERVADLLDQYQVFRPDLLLAWEQGEEQHWQAVLWRVLQQETPVSRAALFARYLTLFDRGNARTDRLPERILLFGINTLAPIYLSILERTAHLVPVHLLHLSPCREFWSDIESDKEQSRKRALGRQSGQPAPLDYLEIGNPLLASLGGLGRDFSHQLLELDTVHDHQRYQSSRQSTLLQLMHNHILDLTDGRLDRCRMPLASDPSIQVHCCHSPLREIQVLHDHLLELFDTHADLRPSDILVMAPNMTAYAAAIRGTFGGVAGERAIPYSLADQATALADPLVIAFIQILRLLGSRCPVSEVLELFDCPALLARFDLQPSDRTLCLRWIEESGIRWGLNQEHRQELELDQHSQNTWQFGLDRLMLGYLFGSTQPQCSALPPVPVLPGETAPLGGLAELIWRLERWRLRCRQPASAQHWQERLSMLLDDFFVPEEDNLSLLHHCLTAFAQSCQTADCQEPLPMSLVLDHLLNLLDKNRPGGAFLAGRVTFCNMVPMRSIPFRVICLLGMDHSTFPRNQGSIDFDLITKHPRRGDRNRRQDDRYLFLETLLSARDLLYISWVGHSQTDNRSQPPSVVVAELLDYLDAAFLLDHRPAGQACLYHHPLQPFSRRCFHPLASKPSYAAQWLPATENNKRPPFILDGLPPLDPTLPIDFDLFCRFWKSPAACFLRRRLEVVPRLRLVKEEDTETFRLDPLTRYQLMEVVTSARLQGTTTDSLHRRLLASGVLPQQGFAAAPLKEMEEVADQFCSRLQTVQADDIEDLSFSATNGLPFQGILSGLTNQGRVAWRPGKLNGSDLLQLWLNHLVLNLLSPPHCPGRSQHHGLDGSFTLLPVDTPLEPLSALLALFRLGLERPLPFFPRTSYAWAKAKGDPEQARKNALKAWQSSPHHHGEDQEQAFRLILGERSFLDAHFIDLADQVFTPALAHLEQS